jgi:hypothetical protein
MVDALAGCEAGDLACLVCTEACCRLSNVYDPRFMNMRTATMTTITMITISTTVLTISSLPGKRVMSYGDLGVRSIGRLVGPVK